MNPALTAAEWRVQLGDSNVGSHSPSLRERLELASYHADRTRKLTLTPHGLSALCLHGETHGFTRQDAENHRTCARSLPNAAAYRTQATWHSSMADRIEALLPPEKPDAS